MDAAAAAVACLASRLALALDGRREDGSQPWQQGRSAHAALELVDEEAREHLEAHEPRVQHRKVRKVEEHAARLVRRAEEHVEKDFQPLKT